MIQGLYSGPVYEKAEAELNKRYSECDASPTGHLKLNSKTGRCDYCFRRGKYVSRFARKNIFGKRIGPRFVDGTGIKRRKYEEAKYQRTLDKLFGVSRIIEESNF